MTKLGNSRYALAPGGVGTQTIVTAVANVNGIRLRTLNWFTNGAALNVTVGGHSIMQATNAPIHDFWIGDLFIEAGIALQWGVGGAGQNLNCSYDLL